MASERINRDLHVNTRQRWDEVMIHTNSGYEPVVRLRRDMTEMEIEEVMSLPVNTGPILDSVWLVKMVKRRDAVLDQDTRCPT